MPLPGWAVQLPDSAAAALRAADPAILTRTTGSVCLVDLRCVPQEQDDVVAETIRSVLASLPAEEGGRP